MKSFVWKGIPVNVPDSRAEWIFLFYVPIAFTLISVTAATIAVFF